MVYTTKRTNTQKSIEYREIERQADCYLEKSRQYGRPIHCKI